MHTNTERAELEAKEIQYEQEILGNRYISLSIKDTNYAIPLKNLKEIIILPRPTPTPEAPGYIRGVIQYRGEVITVVDSRKRLGFRKFEEEDKELIADMAKYKQAHIDWINELCASIEEEREFGLTTDPHACAFGKWYDSFTTDNVPFTGYLKLFDAPHKRIHEIAKTALTALTEQGKDAARAIIQKEKETDLKEIIQLFEDIENVLKASHRELALVIEDDNRLIGLTADSISNILTINPEDIISQNRGVRSKFVIGVHTTGSDVILVLDLGLILD